MGNLASLDGRKRASVPSIELTSVGITQIASLAGITSETLAEAVAKYCGTDLSGLQIDTKEDGLGLISDLSSLPDRTKGPVDFPALSVPDRTKGLDDFPTIQDMPPLPPPPASTTTDDMATFDAPSLLKAATAGAAAESASRAHFISLPSETAKADQEAGSVEPMTTIAFTEQVHPPAASAKVHKAAGAVATTATADACGGSRRPLASATPTANQAAANTLSSSGSHFERAAAAVVAMAGSGASRYPRFSRSVQDAVDASLSQKSVCKSPSIRANAAGKNDKREETSNHRALLADSVAAVPQQGKIYVLISLVQLRICSPIQHLKLFVLSYPASISSVGCPTRRLKEVAAVFSHPEINSSID